MRRTAVVLAMGSLLAVSACGSSGSKAASSSTGTTAAKPGATVNMTFTVFDKKSYAIKAGQALTFVNANPIEHVIVEGTYKVDADGLRTSETDDKAFNLPIPAKKGYSVSQTFDKAGTFTFYCTIHKGMNASVTVS
jgi:plastocyanin